MNESIPKTTPCKLTKCLVHASCKYKQLIECSLLHSFYVKIHDIILSTEYGTKIQTDKRAWSEIHKFFPNLNAIFRDKNKGYHI